MKQEIAGKEEGRVITDEMLALARSRIGAPLKVHTPYNEFVTVDAIRHFAHGTGDDNPLYCDRNYGPETRWGPSPGTGPKKTGSTPVTPSAASIPGTSERPSTGLDQYIPATSSSPDVFARTSSKNAVPSRAVGPLSR